MRFFFIALLSKTILLLSVSTTKCQQHKQPILQSFAQHVNPEFSTTSDTGAISNPLDSLLLNLVGRDSGKKKRVTEALIAMKKKAPEVRELKIRDRTVKFIPMVHVGQPQFYDNVRDIIITHKEQGYIVFYEQIKEESDTFGIGKEAIDSLRRKFRRIVGLNPSRKIYATLKMFFPNSVVQPTYDSLGVTHADINADVSIGQIVEQYETLYGVVEIEPCDVNTPVDGLYTCKPLSDSADPVILDYRNRNLFQMICESPYTKILVVYGAAHIDPVIEMLKE